MTNKTINSAETTHIHPLNPKDAPVVAAMREATSAYKGRVNGPEARASFDAMIGAVPAAADVNIEPGNVGGVTGWWCRPRGARLDAQTLFVHGGGYVLGSARSFCNFVGHLARGTETDTFIPDYRLAPENPFPAAIDDVCAVYRGMTESDSKAVVLAGESAGGGLVLALLSIIGAQSINAMPMPRGAAVFSPWTDLALTGASYQNRADADPIFTRVSMEGVAAQYLQGAKATDPKASPLYSALRGLPSIRIDVGEDEVLLDDSRVYAERAHAAGTDVSLSVWVGMSHCFPFNIGRLAAAGQAVDAICRFLTTRIDSDMA